MGVSGYCRTINTPVLEKQVEDTDTPDSEIPKTPEPVRQYDGEPKVTDSIFSPFAFSFANARVVDEFGASVSEAKLRPSPPLQVELQSATTTPHPGWSQMDPMAIVSSVEQSAAGQAVVLTLRHPDGGFRRLQVTQDGRGVAVADGALPAQVSVEGDRQIGVTIGADRYRLPATVSAP